MALFVREGHQGDIFTLSSSRQLSPLMLLPPPSREGLLFKVYRRRRGGSSQSGSLAARFVKVVNGMLLYYTEPPAQVSASSSSSSSSSRCVPRGYVDFTAADYELQVEFPDGEFGLRLRDSSSEEPALIFRAVKDVGCSDIAEWVDSVVAHIEWGRSLVSKHQMMHAGVVGGRRRRSRPFEGSLFAWVNVWSAEYGSDDSDTDSVQKTTPWEKLGLLSESVSEVMQDYDDFKTQSRAVG